MTMVPGNKQYKSAENTRSLQIPYILLKSTMSEYILYLIMNNLNIRYDCMLVW